MDRQCKCGLQMRLELRTIIAGKVRILHVPIQACEGCSTVDLYPPVKSVLTDYIKELTNESMKRRISFTEVNEITEIIYDVFSQEEYESSQEMEKAVKAAINDRINLLLDVYKQAESIQDYSWIENLLPRLCQLSNLLAEMDQEKVHSLK